MEALASRVGRLEARLDGVREDVLVLHAALGQSGEALHGSGPVGRPAAAYAPSGPASRPPDESAAVAEWVRLFELELEATRRQQKATEGQLGHVQARLREFEQKGLATVQDGSSGGGGGGASGSSSGAEVEELAELVLGELRDLQWRVHALSTGEDLGVGNPPRSDFGGNASRIAFDAQANRRAAGADAQLEALAARVRRLEGGDIDMDEQEGFEATAFGGDDGLPPARGRRSLPQRLQDVEAALQDFSYIRRYGASLQALTAVEEKIEKLQQASSRLPFEQAMCKSEAAIQDLEAAAKKECGSLSVFDAYRVQAGLEQVMVAMEALTRQRNDDIRLLNSYLDEVYKRLDRDLPARGGAGVDGVQKLRVELTELGRKVEAVESVYLREFEARLLREIMVCSDEASSCRNHIELLEGMVQQSLEQGGALEVRLRTLSTSYECMAANDSRDQQATAELRGEMSKLRMDMAELAASNERGDLGVRLETRLAVAQAEMEALVERTSLDQVKRNDRLDRDLQAAKQDFHRMTRESARQDEVDRLQQDINAMQRESVSLDAKLMERVARSEREARGELRVMQQLLLEVGGGFAKASMEGALAGGSPRALPGLGLGPTPPPDQDIGIATAVAPDTVEWRVDGVLARVRAGDGRAVISRAFDVPRFAGASNLRLKLFPQGSKRVRWSVSSIGPRRSLVATTSAPSRRNWKRMAVLWCP
eukprot:TRINITY_DN20773_c0_g1_i2.p1 TRINITY_DN20773_c0_g1~~TRINITY_DN20773_c0_g1_i2.p1  ORF type:complete len:710 (+),score=215.18 TRINITY_DN20773_c0_g1_i2:143-2272(+)